MNEIRTSPIISWILGKVVFTIGVMNLLWVHTAPGMIAFFFHWFMFPWKMPFQARLVSPFYL
jgi:hypothetical protein